MADSEIYDRLRIVETQVTTHEAVCAERYAGIIKTNSEIKGNISTLTVTLVGMGIAIIGGMATILAKILFP
jgi:hypothetical protein